MDVRMPSGKTLNPDGILSTQQLFWIPWSVDESSSVKDTTKTKVDTEPSNETLGDRSADVKKDDGIAESPTDTATTPSSESQADASPDELKRGDVTTVENQTEAALPNEGSIDSALDAPRENGAGGSIETVTTDQRTVQEAAQGPDVPWQRTQSTEVQVLSDGLVTIVRDAKSSSREVFVRDTKTGWFAPLMLEYDQPEAIIFAQRLTRKGQETVCLMTAKTQWCAALTDAVWETQEVRVPKDHAFNGEVIALRHRPRVLLVASTRGGFLRSIDGGRSWRKTQSKGSYGPLGYFGPKVDRLVCAHTAISKTLNGIDCSNDDGRTWQSFLRSRKPVRFESIEGELVVFVDDQALRLVRLLDRGTVKDALLFVGKERRLSKTGKWFVDRLEAPLRTTGDELLVSRTIRPIAEGEEAKANQSLRLQPIGNQLVERWRFKIPSNRIWNYAIVGRLMPAER